MAKKKAVKKTAIKKGSAAAKAKMAKVRKAKKNYILVEADRQTKVKTTNSGGYLYPYNVAKDKLKKAMPPGKRVSKKTGNPYWEYRVNRSDKKGSLTGLGATMYDIRDKMERELNNAISNFNTLKFHKKSLGKQFTQESLLKKYPNYIKSLKKQLREQNKVITSNLR
jgi:esterase/lipase superfamily enzyme